MNYTEYKQLFETILNSPTPQPPYTKADYMYYTKLNYSRMKRWEKTMQLDEALVQKLAELTEPQHWIIIVEPWCGDAAHSLPFLVRLAEQSPLITYELQLRDSEPFLINSYLTNGGKSIPKLIVRDLNGNDLFTWGPRPKPAQLLRESLLAAQTDAATVILQLQNWYNADKGQTLFSELTEFYTHQPRQTQIV
ncbi:thioredoxin family protein [Spirosoma koreense]